MKKKMNILVLFDSAGTPPEDQDFSEELENNEDWFTEAAVIEELREMGHNVTTLGIYDDIRILLNRLCENKPDLVFNLTELFHGKAHLDKNIPAMFDLMQIPYTGCSPDGMILCNNKALSKKILSYHRIKVPGFHTFRIGRKVWIPSSMKFPMFIKPLREEASTGISQASYVENEESFRDRIRYVHENLNNDVIAEEFIHGRELYVSIMGIRRLTAFPIREMRFTNVPEDEPKIATYKAKWDEKYRKKWGIKNGFATDLSPEQVKMIHRTCKKAYRCLNLDGYARFDCRLTPDGTIYIIEANANPELALGDEFAESAQKAGLTFEALLKKLLKMAFVKAEMM